VDTSVRSGETATSDIAALLRNGDVHSVYQPIVDLDSGAVVAVEALARGPEGPLHLPAALFPAAAAADLSAELEWACRAAAMRGAVANQLPRGVALFVNAEPSHLGTTPPMSVRLLETRVRRSAQVVLELTERELVRRPADVLRAVDAARSMGWGVALDDVGVEPASLALMPVVRPDVVKLDMSLIHRPASAAAVRVASAVAAYAEETGAHVLAEGIETDQHLERAIVLGATLGQGWRFGRPGRLERVAGVSCEPISLLHDAAQPTGSSPFALVGRQLPTRIARKSQLLAMSHHLERQTAEHATPPLLLAAFEDAAFFTASTRDRYARYAALSPLVAAFGVGLTEEPASGVRGECLAVSDPLAAEWTVVVLGPHFAGALIARDLGDSGPDEDRRFEFAVTHDRARVTTAARSLVERIASRP
jgi:EAL domain-containing protein (putative c-di-GMP-specific phosphodiesterase class I)